MAKSAGNLLALLHRINILAKKIKLKFNAKKFVTLHCCNKPPAGCRETIFNLNGSNISFLEDGDATKFLSKPVGAFLPRDSVTVENIWQRRIKILTSGLNPWQRIDFLKNLFYPSLQILQRTDQILKTVWTNMDDALKPLIRLVPTVDKYFLQANEYFYGSRDHG